jgi:transcriptional regulator with XRE-family HTH domain
MDIGQQIRNNREKRSVTIIELAKKMGPSRLILPV